MAQYSLLSLNSARTAHALKFVVIADCLYISVAAPGQDYDDIRYPHSTNQGNRQRRGVISLTKPWTNNVVPYVVSSVFSKYPTTNIS